MLMPSSVANLGTYFAYEFQKSESARGRSTPIGGLPLLAPVAVLSLAQAAAEMISTAASADRNAYLMVVPRFTVDRCFEERGWIDRRSTSSACPKSRVGPRSSHHPSDE